MRALDEKRTGLLIRMSYHRACVCSKRVIQPLLRRGFARLNDCENYELTSEGKQAAQQALRDNEGKQLRSYGGISIGSAVMIVASPKDSDK